MSKRNSNENCEVLTALLAVLDAGIEEVALGAELDAVALRRVARVDADSVAERAGGARVAEAALVRPAVGDVAGDGRARDVASNGGGGSRGEEEKRSRAAEE